MDLWAVAIFRSKELKICEPNPIHAHKLKIIIIIITKILLYRLLN